MMKFRLVPGRGTPRRSHIREIVAYVKDGAAKSQLCANERARCVADELFIADGGCNFSR
jgi:hypothetical protein